MLGATRVVAIGPRSSTIRDLGWVQREMERALTRLATRHPALLVVASLAPGVGSLWVDVGAGLGLPVEAWVPHVQSFDHWPEAVKSKALQRIAVCDGLVVPYSQYQAMEPWMYGGHLEAMTATAHAQVGVWNGDPGEFYYSITNRQADVPFHWVNFARRKSSWHPQGRPEGVRS